MSLLILNNNKLQFLLTPSQQTIHGEIGAKLTSRFLAEYHQTVAINGSYFNSKKFTHVHYLQKNILYPLK